MNADSVVSLIGSVGFPIVACTAMAWFYATQFRSFQSMLDRNNLLTEELLALLKKNKDEEEYKDEE